MQGDIKITVNYAPFSATVTVDNSAESISVLISNPLSDIIVTLGNMSLNGIPAGGTDGQVLTKVGSSDYQAAWYDPSGGNLTWEQVLTAGSIVTQFYGSQMISDSQYVNFVTPINFGVGGAGRYTSWIDSNFVNPSSGRKDVVFAFHAYNWVVAGQAEINGEAAYAFKCEQYYEADTTSLFEFHLPEVIDEAGVAHRLWSFYVHRNDGYTYLQSQVGSFSFRPKYDNTGAYEWYNLGGGDTGGTVQVIYNSSYGTGGAAGDQSNYFRQIMYDGTGSAYQFFMVGGGFNLITPGETTLNTGLLNLSRYVRFNQASYYGEGVNFELGEAASDNHGYNFYDGGQNFTFLNLFKNYAVFGTPIVVGTNSTYGNLAFQISTDPIATGGGLIWYNGTDFYTYQSTTKKKFLLEGDAVAPVWGSITGTLSSQTDLQAALDLKLNISSFTWSSLPGKPTFATVATSGAYSDLSGTPSIVAPTRTINTTSPLSGGGNLSADRTLSIADAAADGATKGAAAFTAADFNSASGVISIDYTNGQAASGSLKGFLSSADWTTFNNKVATTRAINTTSPLSGGGDLSADRTLSIADAAADGATKGAAAFTASDFNSASGVISIDYTNGQAASGSLKGFLSSTDWTTFNNKQSALTISTGLTNAAGTVTNDFSTGKSLGLAVIGGIASGEKLVLQSTAHATKGKIYFGLAQTSYWDEANLTFKIAGAGVSAVPTLDVSATYTTTGFPLQIANTGYYTAYFQGTGSANQVAFLFENNRGSFASYGTMFIGGSACNLGNIMGIGRADKLFICADGTSNLGMVVGTLVAQPLILGTGNTERARFLSSGGMTITTVANSGNGLSLTLGSNGGTASASYQSIDFNVPTSGLIGQFLATATNYSASGGPGPLYANSIALLTAGVANAQLCLGAITSGGFISFLTNGFANSNEAMRLDSGGRLGLGVIASGTGSLTGAWFQIKASTTSAAQIKLTVGVAPTSPNDGDIWLESNTNTGLKMRINGVTKTVSLV